MITKYDQTSENFVVKYLQKKRKIFLDTQIEIRQKKGEVMYLH